MSKVKSIFINIAVCVAIALLCLFGYLMLQNVCAEIFINRWHLEKPPENDLENSFSQYGFGMTFILIAVLAPVLEELIFRFLICKGLQLLRLPQWWIIIISATIFMLFHQSWSKVIYQLLMGILFAWIFMKTNNLVWSMLIHFINNAIIVTYTYFVTAGEVVVNLNAGSIILALGLATATTLAVIFLIKKGINYGTK